jgi:hypothetical protein
MAETTVLQLVDDWAVKLDDQRVAVKVASMVDPKVSMLVSQLVATTAHC